MTDVGMSVQLGAVVVNFYRLVNYVVLACECIPMLFFLKKAHYNKMMKGKIINIHKNENTIHSYW